MDGGVASPNPFYFTTEGYGVLRNTFADGSYDFGESETAVVRAAHKEAKLVLTIFCLMEKMEAGLRRKS